MRTERNKDGSWNVWMSREEYQVLLRVRETFEREVAEPGGQRVSTV